MPATSSCHPLSSRPTNGVPLRHSYCSVPLLTSSPPFSATRSRGRLRSPPADSLLRTPPPPLAAARPVYRRSKTNSAPRKRTALLLFSDYGSLSRPLAPCTAGERYAASAPRAGRGSLALPVTQRRRRCPDKQDVLQGGARPSARAATAPHLPQACNWAALTAAPETATATADPGALAAAATTAAAAPAAPAARGAARPSRPRRWARPPPRRPRRTPPRRRARAARTGATAAARCCWAACSRGRAWRRRRVHARPAVRAPPRRRPAPARAPVLPAATSCPAPQASPGARWSCTGPASTACASRSSSADLPRRRTAADARPRR